MSSPTQAVRNPGLEPNIYKTLMVGQKSRPRICLLITGYRVISLTAHAGGAIQYSAFPIKRLLTNSRVETSHQFLAVPRSDIPPRTGGRGNSWGAQQGPQLPEAHIPAGPILLSFKSVITLKHGMVANPKRRGSFNNNNNNRANSLARSRVALSLRSSTSLLAKHIDIFFSTETRVGAYPCLEREPLEPSSL